MVENVPNEIDEALRARTAVMFRGGIGEPATEGDLPRYSVNDLVVALQTFLGELSARALLSAEAAETLYTFAIHACRDLQEVCERKPQLIAPAAERKMLFPCTWPLLRKDQQKVMAMVKRLRVGTKAIFKMHGRKQFNPDLPANQAGLSWVQYIHSLQIKDKTERNRVRQTMAMPGCNIRFIRQLRDPWLKSALALERLSHSNAKRWGEVIWQGILKATNGTPEEVPQLQVLGRHRGRHSLYIDQQKAVTARTAKSNIRDGIRTRILKAVSALASRST